MPAAPRQTVLLGRKLQLPAVLHASQAPLQAWLQQRPLAQKVEVHSAEAPHDVPSLFLATQLLVALLQY